MYKTLGSTPSTVKNESTLDVLYLILRWLKLVKWTQTKQIQIIKMENKQTNPSQCPLKVTYLMHSSSCPSTRPSSIYLSIHPPSLPTCICRGPDNPPCSGIQNAVGELLKTHIRLWQWDQRQSLWRSWARDNGGLWFTSRSKAPCFLHREPSECHILGVSSGCFLWNECGIPKKSKEPP